MKHRIERDPLGEVRVPVAALYGAQTQRAVENFPISGLTAPPELIVATVLVKKAAAQTNAGLGRIDRDIADAIVAAADDILEGAHRDQFVVDIFQAGAGTSHNMNANEVLANLAEERLGGARGSYLRVHPNDHVNMGQSTNDVFPTATRLALLFALPGLSSAATALADSLDGKAREFAHVLKTGRTHLQDAVPITLGQEFGGFADNVRAGIAGVQHAAEGLYELNLGATAVGTGLNAGDEYSSRAVAIIAEAAGLPLRPAKNLFRVTQSMGDVLAYSGAVRRLSVEVGKIASDLRLLSMGPRAGLAEIQLPAVQPGSSIMPGKVNPSIPEMVNQVCYQMIGCDTTILAAAEGGQLELNVMMPVMAWNGLFGTRILSQAMRVLTERCVDGIRADEARARELLDRSTALATALSPHIGYAVTADIAKTAVATGRSIRDIVRERKLLPDDVLDRVLSAEAMTTPGLPGEKRATRVVSKKNRVGVDPADDRRGGSGHRAAAARPAVSTTGPRAPRRTGSRSVAAPSADHGRTPDRRGKRRR